MKLIAHFSAINPIFKILLIVLLIITAHFTVIETIAEDMHHQHKFIILATLEEFGIKNVTDGRWRHLRIKLKLWPGQMQIFEETFREMVVQELQKKGHRICSLDDYGNLQSRINTTLIDTIFLFNHQLTLAAGNQRSKLCKII